MGNVGGNDNEEPRDDLSVILAFSQMLCDHSDADATVRFATDHGWVDAAGQPTQSGTQLARALLQQSGTRSVFRMF